MRLVFLLLLPLSVACGRVSTDAELDAGQTLIDAMPADEPDAGPTLVDATPLPTAPPVTDGQSASIVLGQSTSTPGTGGTTQSTFGNATGIASTGDKLYIRDLGNSRVLRFDGQPATNKPNADLVIGQANFTSNIAGPTRDNFTPIDMFPNEMRSDVWVGGGKVLVVDGFANRVMLYDTVPATSGAQASKMLGQTSFTAGTAGTTASTLRNPSGVWSDGTTIIVADTGNHRVLIWNGYPDLSGANADVVLGQTNFTTAESPSPPTAASMNEPRDVVFDGERLWVSDASNNRIMVWNGIPTTSNTPADYFVGQGNGTTNAAGSGFHGLSSPGQIAVGHGSLFITDTVNFRVVIHSPRPTTSGEAADAVLGNLALDDDADPPGGSNQTFVPRGIGVHGDRLFLSDSNVAVGNIRVLGYDLVNLP